MAGLEGSINTPLGHVQKKTALYVATGLVVVGGIVYWRHKQLGDTSTTDATTTTTDTTDAEIDPATGYAFGSPEDAAALATQAGYQAPSVPTGGGSSSYPSGGTGYSSNGAWVQGVVEYMTTNDLVADPTELSAALGVYITGAYATDNQVSLIQQAIAVQGFPPVSGPTGNPPGINRNPPQSTGGGGTTTAPGNDPTLPAPTGFKAVRVDKGGVSLDWNPVPGAIGYRTTINGKQVGSTVTFSGVYLNLPKPNTSYRIYLQAVNKNNRSGHNSAITVKTKK
jgi:hypothetical protein